MILIVDDSVTMRRIIKNTLTKLGYSDFLLAEDGRDALVKLYSEHPSTISAIITDWNMPIMDGLAFVKEVRKNDIYEDTPIVMVTTEGGKIEVITALKAGVNNYIIKPFTPEVLKGKLEAIGI